MEEGIGQDTLAGLTPLTPARILDHASHRLGYGLSTIDQSFLPDRMTAAHLSKVAWIIYSQVYDEDPTLEGLRTQIHDRRASFGRFASEYAVAIRKFSCFNDDRLKSEGKMNLTTMPTTELVAKMKVIVNEQRAKDLSDRDCRFPNTGATNALKIATAHRELLDAALGTQYVSPSGIKDLQMQYHKVQI
jgi:hypothetical protein